LRIILASKFLDSRGGDTTAVNLLGGWLADRGHAVFPFGTRPSDASPGPAPGSGDADLFPAPLPSNGWNPSRLAAVYRPSAGAALSRLIERRHPDLVHLHNIHYHLGGSVIAAARARRLPVVWTLHDVNLFCPNVSGCREGRPCMECHVARFHRCLTFNCRGGIVASAAAAAEAYLFRALGLWRQVTRFVAPSRFTRLLLELHGVESARIALVEPGLDLERFAAEPGGGQGFLFLGRLAPEKGIDVLLRALRQVPGARLRIAGEGPLRESLERQAGELAPGRVRFLGRLGREEVARELQGADALVLPSVCLEVAPFAILEAAAAAVPVVASAVGGVPEWVEDGRTGLLVPPAEVEPLAAALAQMAAGAARRRELGEAARRMARQRFDPARHCDKLMRVYADAAAA
jgi:glycosyltransferase involved in cell wall biosynthesis